MAITSVYDELVTTGNKGDKMDVNVNVNAASLVTNDKKCEMTREDAIAYVSGKCRDIASTLDTMPTSIYVTIWTEGERRDPVQKVIIRFTYKNLNAPIVQSAHSRNVKKAIDRCVSPMVRQLRKMRTRNIDKRREQRYVDKCKKQHAGHEQFDDAAEDGTQEE